MLVRSTGTEHGVCGVRYARGVRDVGTEAGWGCEVHEVRERVLVRLGCKLLAWGAGSDAGCWCGVERGTQGYLPQRKRTRGNGTAAYGCSIMDVQLGQQSVRS